MRFIGSRAQRRLRRPAKVLAMDGGRQIVEGATTDSQRAALPDTPKLALSLSSEALGVVYRRAEGGIRFAECRLGVNW